MNSIQYKDFKFPYNPQTTAFKCDRSYIKHKYPSQIGAELEDFGVNAIIITGKGIFYGDNAYADFKSLYIEYQKSGVGFVSHPIFDWVTRGLMVGLESNVDNENNVIHYSFEIVADSEPVITNNGTLEYPIEGNNGDFMEGDLVAFAKGVPYYDSSYDSAVEIGTTKKCKKAKIIFTPTCKNNGGVHPWYCFQKGKVDGWVDSGTFTDPSVKKK